MPAGTGAGPTRREWPETSRLRRDVRSTYAHLVPAGAALPLRVIPRGYVDIVWGGGGDLRVAGPDTGPRALTLPSGPLVAVRFRPGHARPLLGAPISALTDARVPLVEIWGSDAPRLADQLEHANSDRGRLGVLRATLLERLRTAPAPDPLVDAAMFRLEARTEERVSQLSRALGVSERQLLRRFTAAVGYGPKTFQRVARLQRLLRLARAPAAPADLALLAVLAGFADQAHLTHECIGLTGMSPAVLVRSCGPA